MAEINGYVYAYVLFWKTDKDCNRKVREFEKQAIYYKIKQIEKEGRRMGYNIAIDGPAGAGKSTIAKLVAGPSCLVRTSARRHIPFPRDR